MNDTHLVAAQNRFRATQQEFAALPLDASQLWMSLLQPKAPPRANMLPRSFPIPSGSSPAFPKACQLGSGGRLYRESSHSASKGAMRKNPAAARSTSERHAPTRQLASTRPSRYWLPFPFGRD